MPVPNTTSTSKKSATKTAQTKATATGKKSAPEKKPAPAKKSSTATKAAPAKKKQKSIDCPLWAASCAQYSAAKKATKKVESRNCYYDSDSYSDSSSDSYSGSYTDSSTDYSDCSYGMPYSDSVRKRTAVKKTAVNKTAPKKTKSESKSEYSNCPGAKSHMDAIKKKGKKTAKKENCTQRKCYLYN